MNSVFHLTLFKKADQKVVNEKEVATRRRRRNISLPTKHVTVDQENNAEIKEN